MATGLSQVLTFTVSETFLVGQIGIFLLEDQMVGKGGPGLAKLGTADCVTELSVGVCIFVFNQTLLRVSGNDGVVIYTVISYFAQLILMTMMGINQGTQPLISYYHGREKRDFCSYIFRIALLCAGVFCISLCHRNDLSGSYSGSVYRQDAGS